MALVRSSFICAGNRSNPPISRIRPDIIAIDVARCSGIDETNGFWSSIPLLFFPSNEYEWHYFHIDCADVIRCELSGRDIHVGSCPIEGLMFTLFDAISKASCVCKKRIGVCQEISVCSTHSMVGNVFFSDRSVQCCLV
ncbi:hypothetical protein ADUPG1_008954 [Aduncisulcus paluster]|uniref:Uncharacterized protein n=1 Tax=Aduncisulcus paluster TaxID=2918883 RepID=A0ABQ5KWP5_9EUKA|nr:hypothetical protein ADUPG1_008954 [Aduncisulcus paluster]